MDIDDAMDLARAGDDEVELALCAEVKRLRAERDALKQDAERYRWLRDTADGSVFAILLCDEPSAWDGIVDSAIAAKGE